MIRRILHIFHHKTCALICWVPGIWQQWTAVNSSRKWRALKLQGVDGSAQKNETWFAQDRRTGRDRTNTQTTHKTTQDGSGLWTEMKNGSVGFSFFHQNVGRFRSVLKTKPNKNETETERFSVGFSVGFSVKPTKKSILQDSVCMCWYHMWRQDRMVSRADQILHKPSWGYEATWYTNSYINIFYIKSYFEVYKLGRGYEAILISYINMVYTKSYINQVGGTRQY